jgi:hypothetical protein
MNEGSASGILLRAVKLLIGTLEGDSGQMLALEEAFHYVAESQNTRLSVRERCAAQQSAAAILHSVSVNNPSGAQCQVLALIRVALTAATFELSGSRNPLQPHEDEGDPRLPSGTGADDRNIFPLGRPHRRPDPDRQRC